MNMPLICVKDFNFKTQYAKIGEEYTEFLLADTGSPEELLEALDLITSVFTYITHQFSLYQIQAALINHNHKLKSRGWQTMGTIKIEMEDAE